MSFLDFEFLVKVDKRKEGGNANYTKSCLEVLIYREGLSYFTLLQYLPT